jgi:hypothetical protein
MAPHGTHHKCNWHPLRIDRAYALMALQPPGVSKMALSIPTAPVQYQPSFERPEDGEAATIQALIETLEKIVHTTNEDMQHGVRGVHAKSHGLLIGEVRVLDNLPPVLAQGVFGQGRHLPRRSAFFHGAG